jgi:uncharacterized Zn finger protein
MFISKLSEFTIRRHAHAKSCQKGEIYYQAGAVINIIQRGNILQAEVQGHEAKPYHVNLNFDDDGLTNVSCTCVYNLEGWCKHIVATMLVCIRQPEAISQHPSLATLLAGLNLSQTQRLLADLVAEDPALIEKIAQYVGWMSNPIAEEKQILTYSTIDIAPFQRQVCQILEDAVIYWEQGYDQEDPITDELLSLVQAAIEFAERGEGHNAIALLEVITSTCVRYWNHVANYGAESGKIIPALNEAWCESILSTELTPAEKVDLQINIETWQDDWNTDFAMSLEALRQGWDDPELVKVLRGSITIRGIWQGKIPDYADNLALVRLKILESQERYSEYLYLAEAEEQTQSYLTMLEQLSRV